MKTKILIAIIVFALTACGGGDKPAQLAKLKKQHAEIAEQINKLETELSLTDTLKKVVETGIKVAVSELKPALFAHYIEVQGKIDGEENVNVSTATGGIIQSILVKEGQQVSKGQVLAKIDALVIEQQIKDLENSLTFATDVYNKQKALWDQNIGSEIQYLQAKNTKESLETKLATVKEQLDMMRIKSPINGSIEDIPIKVGQMLAPGYVAFRVVNFATVKVVADLSESFTQKVNQGDNVIIYLPDLKKEVTQRVDFCSKYINPINRTFQIVVRMNNLDKNLKANMIAVVKINDYRNEKAIVVPINVVQTDMNGNFVYVADSNLTIKRRVTIGDTYEGLTEIKSGLTIGDKLITIGYNELEEGMNISY